MTLTIDAMKSVFLALANDEITREAADRWAYNVLQADEVGELHFSPESDRDRIWSAVMYLYGVDLRDESGGYLHNQEDIRAEFSERFG